MPRNYPHPFLEAFRAAAKMAAKHSPLWAGGEEMATVTHWRSSENDACLEVLREIGVVGISEGSEPPLEGPCLTRDAAHQLLEILVPCVRAFAQQNTVTVATLAKGIRLSAVQIEFRLNLLESLGFLAPPNTAKRFPVLRHDVSFANEPALIELISGHAEEVRTQQSERESSRIHFDSGNSDPLYAQAVEVVLRSQRASISFLQRQLRIDHPRSAHLLEAMEVDGLLSPMGANGNRDILRDTATCVPDEVGEMTAEISHAAPPQKAGFDAGNLKTKNVMIAIIVALLIAAVIYKSAPGLFK